MPAGLPQRRRPAKDYVPCAEVAALALRVVSGYQVDQARIADVLAGLGELPAHPDVLLAVRLPAWRHWWQSRRTVGDRHLLGDHRFHGHLGDVGGVAAEEHDLRLRLHRTAFRKAHWPVQRSP